MNLESIQIIVIIDILSFKLNLEINLDVNSQKYKCMEYTILIKKLIQVNYKLILIYI